MSEVFRSEQKGVSLAVNYLAKSTVVFLLFFIPFFQSLYSEAQKNEDQGEIQHEVTVTLKLVQVYVTDKKGDPVVDLEKEDFLIFDNGKKQVITEFERHILQFPYSMIYRRFISSEESASRLKYQNMLKELTASSSTIFTLDTEELKKMNMDIWQRGAFTLQTLASSTGGKIYSESLCGGQTYSIAGSRQCDF